MRNSTILKLAAIGMALAITASCGHKKESGTSEQIMPVDVAKPIVDSVTLHKTYPGVAYANATANVVGRVNGLLLTKNYQSGALVKKGDILFTIEPSTYRDAVQQAQAALSTAQSEYEYAANQYKAMQKALESDAVSQMDVIQAKSNMEKAEAAIKNAKAALNKAQTMLGYCTVRAPFTGHISSATLDPGAYVSGEGAPVELATIYDDSSLIIVFSIENSQYESMIGQSGKIDSEIYKKVPLSFEEPLSHEYYANLCYLSPAVDTNTGTLQLKVSLDNPYGELKPGMYITVNLPYGTEKNAILVKDAAVSTDQQGKYLYVVNDSNKVVYTPITVGDIYQDSLRIVTGGITPQSRYVTSALLKVRDGMEVKPVMSK